MRPRSSKRWILTALAGLLSGPLAAADWPQFRGPQRDGVSAETGLLDSWPEGGPKEVWRRPIGEGYSAATVVGGRIYTLYAGSAPEGDEEGDKALEYAAALDAATGEELWRTAVGDKIETEFGNGPRSTPVVDGDAVYVLGSHGDFAALGLADGARRWAVKLTEVYGSSRPGWGFATSALVDGDLVLVEAGGGEGNGYVALDKKTGEARWTFGDAQGPGYNSALAVDAGGERRFVYIASGMMRAVGADGEEVWSHPWRPFESHGMPIFIPPDRYFASGVGGDDEGAVVLRVASDGGEPAIEEVWKSRVMKNHFSSSLLHDGYIYGFDNATMKCISAATGETAWAKRGLGKGSLIYADGNLIVLSDRGKLLLVEATSEGYEEKGSVQALEGKSWTAPTLSESRLYLRNHSEMVSYDLKGE